MKQQEHWIEIEGTRLYALQRGEGPPVVALHGGLGDHRAAWRFAEPLAHAGCTVITPDLRGSGRSHFHGALSWTRLADDIAAWLDALRLPRVLLAGTSFGCGVALVTALRHRDRIAALGLLQPSHAGTRRGRNAAQAQALAAMRAAGERTLTEGIEALVPLFVALPEELRERGIAMARSFDPGSVAATTRFLDEGGEPFEALADLAAITAPTVIVPGTDPTHPAPLAELYAQHIATARCVAPDGPVTDTLLELARGGPPSTADRGS